MFSADGLAGMKCGRGVTVARIVYVVIKMVLRLPLPATSSNCPKHTHTHTYTHTSLKVAVVPYMFQKTLRKTSMILSNLCHNFGNKVLLFPFWGGGRRPSKAEKLAQGHMAHYTAGQCLNHTV